MSWAIRTGDAASQLAELDAESVHCCITSPPYWGLRDYGTGTWEGGDPDCDHKSGPQQSTSSTLAGNGHGPGNLSPALQAQAVPMAGDCAKCGAHRVDEQLGLEPTPELYVERLVDIFRAIRRVLRPDGTCWLVIGDSYASRASGRDGRDVDSMDRPTAPRQPKVGPRHLSRPAGFKSKDLIGVPWMVAFALRADGWWLRSDTVWAKPNPMPESVTDRPTRAHEYVFLLTKSQRYYFDHVAIREDFADYRMGRPGGQGDRSENHNPGANFAVPAGIDPSANGGRSKRDVWSADDPETVWWWLWDNLPDDQADALAVLRGQWASERASRSDVWHTTTQPYPEAHFATFPPKLIEPCVLAGTSPRVCRECGAPWRRVTSKEQGFEGHSFRAGKSVEDCADTGKGAYPGRQTNLKAGPVTAYQTIGWDPTCEHEAKNPATATVLDPFAGAGTTGLVAQRHGRDFIGVELSAEFAQMARDRIARDMPLMAPVDD